MSEDQVNPMEEKNNFMNKWSEHLLFCLRVSVFLLFLVLIKKSFPWLWEMKALISECPNLTPVGLGNSESAIDMSGYEAGYKTDGNGLKPVTDEDEDMNLDAGMLDADDEDNEDISIPRKCPADSGYSVERKPVLK